MTIPKHICNVQDNDDEAVFLHQRLPHTPLNEIFSFNTMLSAVIERGVVKTLNFLRPMWDKHNKYERFKFLRQSSIFPDVLLRNTDTKEIIMGIELKGWYIFAKENEPSFRYLISPSCCAPQDIVAVFPWYLDEITKGKMVMTEPYLEYARYAAEYRNYHWQNLRKARTDSSIISPINTRFYPQGREACSDCPVSDKGNNFGRFARSGIMDKWLQKMAQHEIRGFPVKQIRKHIKTKLNF
jgi:hypothetical protein